MGEGAAAGRLVQWAQPPAVLRPVVFHPGEPGDPFAAEARLQTLGQLLDVLAPLHRRVPEQGVLTRVEFQQPRRIQAERAHRPGQAQPLQALA
jgi:hypothetical protein